METLELSALAGAGSAALAAIAYWAKTRHERRRVTRSVLYYLLELHHGVSRTLMALTHIEAMLLSEVKRALTSRNLTFNEPEQRALLENARPHLQNFALAELEATFLEGAENYLKVLTELSRENPILAFRLRGRDKLALLTKKLETFAKTSPDNLGASAQHIALLNKTMLKLSMDDLQNAIRATSLGCDLVTHIRTRLLLKSSADNVPSDGMNEIIRTLVEDMFSSQKS